MRRNESATLVTLARPHSANWRASAFGLDLDLDFPAPPLSAAGALSRDPTRVELISVDQLEQSWSPAGSVRVAELRLPDDSEVLEIDHSDGAGFLVTATGFGKHLVSPDGSTIKCAPPSTTEWTWQRLLIAQVLPLAATLKGFELLHASAVAIGGRVVAFVGPSGAGKTSVAMNLLLRGASFITDDVLAIEEANGSLLAHHGAAMASIRHQEHDRLGVEAAESLGRDLGNDYKVYRAVANERRALPLGALYFLERGGDVGGAEIETIPALDPRLLLANAFGSGAYTDRRLVRQLEIFAQLEQTVPIFRAQVAPSVTADRFAEYLNTHITEVLGSRN